MGVRVRAKVRVRVRIRGRVRIRARLTIPLPSLNTVPRIDAPPSTFKLSSSFSTFGVKVRVGLG